MASKENKSLIFIKSSVIALGVVLIALLASLFIKITKADNSKNNRYRYCKENKAVLRGIGKIRHSNYNNKGELVIISSDNIIILDKCLNVISQRRLSN